MAQFKIINLKNGLEFFQERDEVVLCPEYGKPERYVHESQCSEEDIASALDERVIFSAPEQAGFPAYEIKEYLLPAEYTIEEILPPPGPTQQELNAAKMAEVRRLRNERLAASDFSQFIDAPLTAEQKQQWREYRTALRNIPNNIPDIAEYIISFPPRPDEQE